MSFCTGRTMYQGNDLPLHDTASCFSRPVPPTPFGAPPHGTPISGLVAGGETRTDLRFRRKPLTNRSPAHHQTLASPFVRSN